MITIDQQWEMPKFNSTTGKWEFRVLDGAGSEIRTEQFDTEDEACIAHRNGFIDLVAQ